MSQCVPNWDLDNGVDPRNPNSTANTNIHAPMSDYVVSELTWEKDHPSKHGFHGRPSRRAAKLPQRRPTPGGDPAWEKHPANYTLEAVVDQATRAIIPAAVDALVPSTKPQDQVDHLPAARVVPDVSGVRPSGGGGTGGGRKRPRPGATGEGYSRSATGSATSAGLAFDSRDINADGGEDAGFATSNPHLEDSPETDHASCGRALTAVSEEDDSCYSRRLSQKYESDEERKTDKYKKERSTTSTKRNRTAAVHNQSERKRRDRINQRMRTLQKLVPNSIKNDKASILDEVIDYMKQLQAQVQMMNRMNSMSPMMMPMAMQQMQMAMMAQMAQMAQMGMVMGMGLPDMGQLPGMPWGTAVPSFLPLTLKRDIAGRDQQGQMSPAAAAGAAPFPPDPFAVFMALQTQQPMPMDAHNKMAALCHQPPQQAAPPAPTNETQGGTSGKV